MGKELTTSRPLLFPCVLTMLWSNAFSENRITRVFGFSEIKVFLAVTIFVIRYKSVLYTLFRERVEVRFSNNMTYFLVV